MSAKKSNNSAVVPMEGGDANMDQQQLDGLKAAILNSPEAMAMMQNKLSGMIGLSSGYYESLPSVVKRRVKALKNIQVESLKIEADLSKEIHELECKYASMMDPLNKKRCDIVNGVVEPTDEECNFPSDEEEEEDEEEEGKEANGEVKKEKKEKVKEEESEEDKNIKGIPEFWLTILKNVELIAENIQEHDEPILEHLTDINVKMIAKPMGFTLEFHFSPNEYFTNEVLTKHYEMKSAVDENDPFSFEGAEITRCRGCDINWKKGKNVTVRTVQKKQKHKSKGNVRVVSKTVTADSFFNFFSPPTVPEDEDEMEPETQDILTADFEIGETIRQRLVQRAVLYFTGEALADDYDSEDEEDEDGDDDEEDSEDDEDFEPPKVTKGGKGGRGGRS